MAQAKRGDVVKVRAAAREAFGEEVSCSSPKDRLVVQQEHRQVRVIYRLVEASPTSREATFVQFRVDIDCTEMWIGKLEVAGPHRSKGIGRQVVRAVEEIARTLGIRVINLFPLFGSEPFWRKMGYGLHHRTARAMSKTVSPGLGTVQQRCPTGSSVHSRRRQ